MNKTSKSKAEKGTRPDFNSRTMIPRTKEESDIAAADAEHACGLMTWARLPEEDWSAYDLASEKAFDQWHKLGPQSAQY